MWKVVVDFVVVVVVDFDVDVDVEIEIVKKDNSYWRVSEWHTNYKE